MNGVDMVKSAFNAAHAWYDGTVADLTHDLANEVPPGRVHPISEQMAHVLQSEDAIINGMIRHQPTVWDSGNWSERLGIANMSRHTTDAARAFRADPAALQPYREAVYASTSAWLDSLSEADLDREIDLSGLGMGMRRVGDVLTGLAVGNTFAHTGEISALKGTMGATGYPF